MKQNTSTILAGAAIVAVAISFAGCTTDDITSHPVTTGCTVVGTCLAPGIGTAAGFGVGAGIENMQKADKQDARLAVHDKALDRHERGLNYLYENSNVPSPEVGTYQPPSDDWMSKLAKN